MYTPHLRRVTAKKSDLLMKQLTSSRKKTQRSFVLDLHFFTCYLMITYHFRCIGCQSLHNKDKKDNFFYKQIIQFYYPDKMLPEIITILENYSLKESPQIHIKLLLWVCIIFKIIQFFSSNLKSHLQVFLKGLLPNSMKEPPT